MATLAFDTLAFSKKLRGHFTAEQAETLAEAFVAGADEQLSTKADLRDLDQKIEVRFAQLELRIAETANKTLIWTIGSIFSMTALIIAVLKLVP